MWGTSLSNEFRGQRQHGARHALLVLSCINLLNFADRYVLSSVKTLIKKDLHLSDTQTALPATGMLLIFMLSALFFGYLSDQKVADRRSILAMAVVLWSGATALAGVAKTFSQLLIFRSLIGVGEAAYMTIVPPMLADFYPVRDRNMVFTVFYLCSPLGGALGFIVGSIVGGAVGWRVAFFVCGVPGVLLATLIVRLSDPVRGINDENLQANTDEQQDTSAKGLSNDGARDCGGLLSVLRVPHWDAAVVGMIACSFVVGGMSDWFGTFILRTYNKASIGQVGTALGAATMLGGIGGTLLGSKVAHALESRLKNAFFLVPAMFMVLSAALLFVAVNVNSSLLITYVALLLAWTCFFCYSGPMNAAMINCMPVHLRSRSQGLGIFLSHILGDVISPPIIGAISDASGSLRAGMQLVWIGAVFAALCWGIGGACLSQMENVSSTEKEDQGSSVCSLFAGGGEVDECKILSKSGKRGYASTEEASFNAKAV